ncbi:hypothetical protein L873DRAFT_123874 [Choiromyces venosus 120613-1]|uniref:Uncharacterized protein n=1 Tax=Choiromyces venosus 120613-1 TaxID=1336337 RepID=A0A3N4J6I6_9PEZI|nr:hypothetical protein L873DRAFT_123874 [Choiromyces venosus 120613-1]
MALGRLFQKRCPFLARRHEYKERRKTQATYRLTQSIETKEMHKSRSAPFLPKYTDVHRDTNVLLLFSFLFPMPVLPVRALLTGGVVKGYGNALTDMRRNFNTLNLS